MEPKVNHIQMVWPWLGYEPSLDPMHKNKIKKSLKNW